MEGLANELSCVGLLSLNSVGVVLCQEAPVPKTGDYSTFWDNVSGAPLETSMVLEARKVEIKELYKHNVYTKVPISECFGETGKRPIGTRWVDVNKGDENHPEYRSRLVAQELKRLEDRDDTFAATPPLEALKFILSLCMTESACTNKRRYLKFIDIKRAHFHSPVTREIYVELPPEDHTDGYCGRLNMSMYGTRDAASNWEAKYTSVMLQGDFIPGVWNPCIFKHKARSLQCYGHGDDFIAVGSDSDLSWFTSHLSHHFEVKDRGTLGDLPHHIQEIRCLNRMIRWCVDQEIRQPYIEYEPDNRHAEIVVKQLGLDRASGAKAVATPGVKTSSHDSEPLDAQTSSLFRSICMRINFLALDRPELQFAGKEAARGMSLPTHADFEKMKRIGRFLKHCPRTCQRFKLQPPQSFADVYVDSDHAGCLGTRKSTNGGVQFHGSHSVRTYSSTQTVLALSSGESEFYSIVKGISTCLGFRAMAHDFGLDLKCRLHTDSSSAKAIATRKGVGKIRHLHTQSLWVQDKVYNKEVLVAKVPGKSNLADFGTKHLDQNAMWTCLTRIGFAALQGQSNLSLKAAQ